jgi:MFS family permease
MGFAAAIKNAHPNIRYIMIHCLMQGTFDSLWQGSILIIYLQTFMGDPKYVGYIEGIQGMAGLITAIPIGYLSDRWGRVKVIRMGFYFSLATLLATLLCTLWIGNDPYDGFMTHTRMTQYICFCVVLGCWGIMFGLINGPLLALFADSIP